MSKENKFFDFVLSIIIILFFAWIIENIVESSKDYKKCQQKQVQANENENKKKE